MSAEAQLTPMMAQYRRIKGELPKDALLLFRLGDFYEMFFEDAQTGSQILNLFLTAVWPNGKIFGLAVVDLTTGEFLATELENETALVAEMERLRPAEIIYPSEKTFIRDLLGSRRRDDADPAGTRLAAPAVRG